MGKLHEEPHVARALEHLDAARRELNMAGGAYAIGVYGADEPFGMVERALKRTLTHAFPDVDADEVYRAMVDSGEDIGYCVDMIRREKAERETLLDPYREYERPSVVDRFGSRMWELPSGWVVSLVPYGYPGDEEEDRRAIAREDFAMAPGGFVGGRFQIDHDRMTADLERVGGLDYVAAALSDLMELPQR